MEEYPRLFTPIKLGSLQVNNRFVVPPMATGLAAEDGTVTQALIDYWVARAKGGWGLVIVEFTAIDPLGKFPAAVCLWDDKFIPGLLKLTDAVRKCGDGTRIAVQLGHAGRQTTSQSIGGQLVSSSPIRCSLSPDTPRELSREETYHLIEKFGDAAVRAREAGFDAVMIHGAHGYLVAQFMSGYFNKRTDEFGGSFDNRMRFPVEIIRNIRRKVGSSFPVAFRLSAEERVPGGRALEESRMVARVIERAGIDVLDVSAGVAESDRFIIAPSVMPPGFLLSAAEEIKKAVSIPVIAVGRINHPLLAEDAIEAGKADLIAFGRASFADPEFPKKVAKGRLDEICPCVVCLNCVSHLFTAGERVKCLANPFCGREGELKIGPASKRKSIVIIGGGPGGLEAAWIAAARGHTVTLYEKNSSLGGQCRTAAIPPFKQDIARAIFYYVHMCERHGVRFKLGVEATREQILNEKPDAVILATGGEPAIPNIKGLTGANATNAVEIIEGRRPAGARVLIVGGGSTGCETADLLGEHLHQVTIVEMLDDVAVDVPPSIRYFLMERLRAYGVRIETGVTVKEFFPDGVSGEKGGRAVTFLGFDTIVLAMGVKSVDMLKEQLSGKVQELCVIGDALTPRQAIDAIEEGARIGASI